MSAKLICNFGWAHLTFYDFVVISTRILAHYRLPSILYTIVQYVHCVKNNLSTRIICISRISSCKFLKCLLIKLTKLFILHLCPWKLFYCWVKWFFFSYPPCSPTKQCNIKQLHNHSSVQAYCLFTVSIIVTISNSYSNVNSASVRLFLLVPRRLSYYTQFYMHFTSIC